VATNIAGPELAVILKYIAFSKQRWGIASALMSLFDNNTIADNVTPTNDYYTSSKVFLLVASLFTRPTPWWMYQYGMRDAIFDVADKVALFTQNLMPYVGPIKSSPESYNVTIANSLYDWSKAAIAKYA
jgi:hypothetical protein